MRARSNAVTGDVQAGDIMVKHSDGGTVSNLIQFGQLFGRGTSKYTHAGIASSSTTIIEMSGSGINENNLLTDNHQITYDVFRYFDNNIALGACETAKMMYSGFAAQKSTGSGMNVSYDAKGAFMSISSRSDYSPEAMNSTLDRLLTTDGKGTGAFFCSGHVVLCYQIAMGQAAAQGILPVEDAAKLFSLADNCYQPSFLHKILSESSKFTRVGTVKGIHRIA